MYQRLPISRTRLWIVLAPMVLGMVAANHPLAGQDPSTPEHNAFFETAIRPALLEHCVECHSVETEASGGLLLDSKPGWKKGGDSGAAIHPGDPDASSLMVALRYDDPNLQMPPEGKLDDDVIAAFEKWIAAGAHDPRESDLANAPRPKPATGLLAEEAQQHWSYRPLGNPQPPAASARTTDSPIDRFLEEPLRASGLTTTTVAEHSTLMRRIHFDLTGLPPVPPSIAAGEQSDRSANENADTYDAQAYEQTVEALLASPHFGEKFARHWMDVARYAESITLRGFVLPEAWRYRDYLVEAFNEDRPFDQMIREQIAGDLLESDDLHQRQLQRIATAFLVMGNTNLERADKTQLEMDFIDEQIDVLGQAFLGQTIGCARCHDHKFDPIPTRDYYALAGIFRSTTGLRHPGLSRWIEEPLPVEEEAERHYQALAQRSDELTTQIAALKKSVSKKLLSKDLIIPVADLEGVVVDSKAAKLVGTWAQSSHVGPYIGEGYLHDNNEAKGTKTATFEPPQLPAGKYEVRFAYSADTNRASNVVVRVFSANEETVTRINQRQVPPEDGLWVSLGEYQFEKDGQAFVLVSNEGSNGFVIIDAVQFLPRDTIESTPETQTELQTAAATEAQKKKLEEVKTAQLIKALEAEQKSITLEIRARPRYLTLVENETPTNLAIHIRGDWHNLGEPVPRGFLTALPHSQSFTIDENASGRLELAHWLASAENPLTARVYANRVWSWLMGQGLVASLNNFGTTGQSPTHPELLDWLANELIQNNWSTKHLVRTIVMSDAYRRRVALQDLDHDQAQRKIDPKNETYWRGHSRRVSVEALRDAMLQISGELDLTPKGSSIRGGTKSDYDYQSKSKRRSLYQPVFRNSLPELFEAFDFADSSVSVGKRSRSTVATQALVLMNHPWVIDRAEAAAKRFRESHSTTNSRTKPTSELVDALYHHCFYRSPTAAELATSVAFLESSSSPDDPDRLAMLIHSLFASIDFRYLP